MAKWGAGDPRWIVEQRPDATNVNNWHWVEKDATNWSKKKLTELLTGLIIADDNITCEITEVTKLEGEASANNRKAKLIFFYEWLIQATWKGKLKNDEKTVEGKLEVPNLSEEHEPHELDVIVTTDETTDTAYIVKELMRKLGSDHVQRQLACYIKELKEEYSQGVILPTGDDSNPKSKSSPQSKVTNTTKEQMRKVITDSNQSAAAGKSVGVKIPTRALKMEEEFLCGAADLYRALTDIQMVQAFTGSEAILEVEKGGSFSMFGGNITGHFTELIHDEKIRQEWRCKNWPEAHYSHVTMDFQEGEGKTIVKLSQTGIPDSDYDRTLEGWKQNYWQRVKQTFGYGAHLY